MASLTLWGNSSDMEAIQPDLIFWKIFCILNPWTLFLAAYNSLRYILCKTIVSRDSLWALDLTKIMHIKNIANTVNIITG